MKKKKQKKDEMVYKITVKLRFGWTESLINRFMPEPDRYVDNPHYRCAPMACLYSVKRIKRIEKTKKFRSAMEIVQKRRERAEKRLIDPRLRDDKETQEE